jgi:hypothetical protein
MGEESKEVGGEKKELEMEVGLRKRGVEKGE